MSAPQRLRKREIFGIVLFGAMGIGLIGRCTSGHGPPTAAQAVAASDVASGGDAAPTADSEIKQANPLMACVEADNRLADDWLRAIKTGRSNGDMASGEFHDHLRAMVDSCRPVLPAFNVDLRDRRKARMAKMCRDGFRYKIQAYQDMLDGTADDKSAEALIKGGELLAKCNAYADAASQR